jgi:hypothetical protein
MKTKTKEDNGKEKNMSRKDDVMRLIAFSLYLSDFITPEILVISSMLAPGTHNPHSAVPLFNHAVSHHQSTTISPTAQYRNLKVHYLLTLWIYGLGLPYHACPFSFLPSRIFIRFRNTY